MRKRKLKKEVLELRQYKKDLQYVVDTCKKIKNREAYTDKYYSLTDDDYSYLFDLSYVVKWEEAAKGARTILIQDIITAVYNVYDWLFDEEKVAVFRAVLENAFDKVNNNIEVRRAAEDIHNKKVAAIAEYVKILKEMSDRGELSDAFRTALRDVIKQEKENK